MNRPLPHLLAAMVMAVSAVAAPTARAALFEDDEARRAILELRQRVEQQRVQTEQRAQSEQRLAEELRRITEENATFRRSLLDLHGQIEVLRNEIARVRGTDEQLARDIADLQRRQRDVAQGMEERLRRFEPVKVNVDGQEFAADPVEQREFEAALAVFRRGDFPAAQAAFADFTRRYAQSGYRASALFWLGNAQYATRDYRGAIATFRALLAQSPDHPRAPEAVLSVANSQIELKDVPAARRTLEDLVLAYPQSEAAGAARERLVRLR